MVANNCQNVFDELLEKKCGCVLMTDRWQGPGGTDVGDAAGNGVGESSRGARIAMQDGGVLIIPSADESDSGNYTCIVENVAGRRTRSVWIAVSGKDPS